MLQGGTPASAKPDTQLEYTIDMDDCHPSISKPILFLRTAATCVGVPKDENIAQVA
jgi:hypothetical protein